MSKSASIKNYVNCIMGELEFQHGVDFDEMRITAFDLAWERADSAVIYYSNAQEWIDELEQNYGHCVSDTGDTYEAHQWREAMQAYAFQLVVAALNDHLDDAIDELEASHEIKAA